MSEDQATTRFAVVCADEDSRLVEALAAALRRLAGPELEVLAFASDAEAIKALLWLREERILVPAILSSSCDLLDEAHRTSGYLRTRKLRIDRGNVEEHLTERGAIVHARLRFPTDDQTLRRVFGAQFTTYLLHHAPEAVDRFGDLIDCSQLRRAFVELGSSRQRLATQLRALGRSFLASADLSDEDAEAAMIRGLDQALNHPPRQLFNAGSTLVVEDEPVPGIWIVIDGDVQLTRRSKAGEVVLDPHSSGPIVGLLALAQRQHAFFTGRALTDVRAIHVTWEQLDAAMESDPHLSAQFVTVLVRSLIARLRHIVDLQMEVETLNERLQQERDQLAAALQRLEQAQIRLVAQEKMATLGQLAAKMAHELNNPLSAINRAADYIAEDVAVLLGGLPDFEIVNTVLRAALSESPMPTREARQKRDELAAATGDEDLARRLMKVGIVSAEQYRGALAGVAAAERDRRLLIMERAYQLGVSLRNVRSSSQRLTGIVHSLKSYARNDDGTVDNVDIHEGIEDTLRLFGPTLMDIEVVRQYGQIPRIECRPAELNQVWTNLISNAIEAMHGRGALTIQTDAPDQRHVRVRIADTGGGIPPENLPRIFDLNFTTKRGQAQFGLGMGLVICRQIVTRHGGGISAESRPGHTMFTVVLPLKATAPAEE